MQKAVILFAALAALLGCGAGSPDSEQAEPVVDDCSYPTFQNAITADGALPKLAWTTAVQAGQTRRFDLVNAHHRIGEWSPFDVLVFVAIPSW